MNKPKRVSLEQRQEVLRMLARGEDRETIAASVGVTPGQVSAIAAHVKMGTYTLPAPDEEQSHNKMAEAGNTGTNLLRQLQKLEGTHKPHGDLPPILLGSDAETGEEVHWNPDPKTGAANPHVLVLGESGFGKTYTISCLLGELAQHGILSIVFDYGQGIALKSLPSEFVAATKPVEILASREGIDINPLQIFPSDVLGPVSGAPAFFKRAFGSSEQDFENLLTRPHTAARGIPEVRVMDRIFVFDLGENAVVGDQVFDGLSGRII